MDVYMHRGRARSERYASPSPLCPHAAYPERERECVTVSLCVREARERSTVSPCTTISAGRELSEHLCVRAWRRGISPCSRDGCLTGGLGACIRSLVACVCICSYLHEFILIKSGKVVESAR